VEDAPVTDANPPKRRVAIFIFDDVEVLDFAGPFEVFAVTGQRPGPAPFEVYTVARTAAPIRARNGLTVVPTYAFDTAPQPDILCVPGGYGTRPLMHDREVLDWIARVDRSAELVISVCTGALLLAKAGLLGGLHATTHHGAFDLLEQSEPTCVVHRDRRVVDNGRIILSAGVAAGIDMSFGVVAKLLGPAVADETARYIEYDWESSAAGAQVLRVPA
jgi:transcriptional regulator GlxA family with amidase domain